MIVELINFILSIVFLAGAIGYFVLLIEKVMKDENMSAISLFLRSITIAALLVSAVIFL